MVLAASSYITLHILTQSPAYLSCAVTILEFGVLKSQQAFQHRLLLVRLYQLLGAPSLALEHYRKMNIKMIQHDALAHFVISRCSTFSQGALGDLTYIQLCMDCSEVYTNNTSEVSQLASVGSILHTQTIGMQIDSGICH